MIAQASRLFPDKSFAVGDIGALPYAHGSLGGIVSRYSLIHMDPSGLGRVFAHWADLLTSGASVVVSFFAADDLDSHGKPFDHKVATAYQLSPDVLLEDFERAGIEKLSVTRRGPLEGERPIGHASIMGTRRQDA